MGFFAEGTRVFYVTYNVLNLYPNKAQALISVWKR